MARTRKEWRLVEVAVKRSCNVLDEVQSHLREGQDPAVRAYIRQNHLDAPPPIPIPMEPFDFDRAFWEMASSVRSSRLRPQAIGML